jgi:hypothetical protein
MDRILWAWPDARLGYRSWEAPPFELYQQRRWEDRILALLSCQPTYPARFVLSAPAEVRFGRFYDEIQKRIREDEGDLALVPGWASKLCGITGRLAGLLQAISNLDRNGDPFSCDHISLQAMESSLALSKYFASHCVRVYKNAGFATGSGTAEARLLRLLKRIGSLVDSQGLVRDQAIWQSIKGPSFPSKADLDFLLDGLIKKGHLLLITSRPKLYRLHPSHLNSTQQSALGV